MLYFYLGGPHLPVGCSATGCTGILWLLLHRFVDQNRWFAMKIDLDVHDSFISPQLIRDDKTLQYIIFMT
jgi:hypothetical protein